MSRKVNQVLDSTNEFEIDIVRAGLKVAAIMVHETDGGSIRSISGRGMTRPHGRFPSVKTRRTMPWDATLQRIEIHISEADPTVVDYVSEPLRLEIHSAIGKLIYIPDLMRIRSDGTIEVVEIKKSLDEVTRDAHYAYKMECARDLFDHLGWEFDILDAEDVQQEPRCSNAASIVIDRSTTVSTGQCIALANAIADNGGVIDMGEAIAVLGDSENFDCNAGRARLNALIVRRFVDIDINRKLTIHSPVRLRVDPDPPNIKQMVDALRRPAGVEELEVV